MFDAEACQEAPLNERESTFPSPLHLLAEAAVHAHTTFKYQGIGGKSISSLIPRPERAEKASVVQQCLSGTQ